MTNFVTIGFLGGASRPLAPSWRFTVVVVCRLLLREPRPGNDRDAKLATLLHRARSRNQKVRSLNVNMGRRETTTLTVVDASLWCVAMRVDYIGDGLRQCRWPSARFKLVEAAGRRDPGNQRNEL